MSETVLASSLLELSRIMTDRAIPRFDWEVCPSSSLIVHLSTLVAESPAHEEWLKIFDVSADMRKEEVIMSVRGVQPFLWDELVGSLSSFSEDVVVDLSEVCLG